MKNLIFILSLVTCVLTGTLAQTALADGGNLSCVAVETRDMKTPDPSQGTARITGISTTQASMSIERFGKSYPAFNVQVSPATNNVLWFYNDGLRVKFNLSTGIAMFQSFEIFGAFLIPMNCTKN